MAPTDNAWTQRADPSYLMFLECLYEKEHKYNFWNMNYLLCF